jgi:hypothetical protein
VWMDTFAILPDPKSKREQIPDPVHQTARHPLWVRESSQRRRNAERHQDFSS